MFVLLSLFDGSGFLLVHPGEIKDVANNKASHDACKTKQSACSSEIARALNTLNKKEYHYAPVRPTCDD